jgi:uroporphyrinogen decarboxylase
MNKIINVIKNHTPYNPPPIWIMRQAGRYLPEYLEVRNKVENFLDLCYNPVLASKVTLQPINRFGFDAAIIFSDILVIPDALGIKVNFIKNHGPVLADFSLSELHKIIINNIFLQKLQPVFEAVSLTKIKLNKQTSLIGFAGAPFTLACYMLQGGVAKNFDKIKQIATKDKEKFIDLLNLLTEAIILFLEQKIKSGVDIIKIFDSWAGILPCQQMQDFIINPAKKIVDYFLQNYPQIPIIYFPKNIGVNYNSFLQQVNCNVLAIDQTISLDYANNLFNKKKVVLQGNLDNFLLAFGNEKEIITETEKILLNFKNKPFIFNLGHGILPQTPISNVELLLKIINNKLC